MILDMERLRRLRMRRGKTSLLFAAAACLAEGAPWFATAFRCVNTRTCRANSKRQLLSIYQSINLFSGALAGLTAGAAPD